MACPCCNSDQVTQVLYCRECGNTVETSNYDQPHEKKNASKTVGNKRNKNVEKPSNRFKLNPPPSPVLMDKEIRTATDRISTKETNRTLLEFQSKDGTMPEWRVQLQNAVRQRTLDTEESTTPQAIEAPPREEIIEDDDDFFDNAEIIEVNRQTTAPNDVLSSALSRIDASREKYLIKEELSFSSPTGFGTAAAVAPAPVPEYEETNPEKTSVNFPLEEVELESSAPTVEYDPKINLYDTSELDPEFVPATVTSSFGKFTPATESESNQKVTTEIAEAEITEEEVQESVVYDEVNAPFAFRFNAGLFDLLTSSFASMILMAPFVLLGGNWMSISGLFGFLTIFTIVSFLYLTTTVGLFGKSFGMHLFSLEMIHANGEEYPSFHQSAVSSSLYLLSVASLGAGFITCLFDDERRAVHDIISDTIIVREE